MFLIDYKKVKQVVDYCSYWDDLSKHGDGGLYVVKGEKIFRTGPRKYVCDKKHYLKMGGLERVFYVLKTSLWNEDGVQNVLDKGYTLFENEDELREAQRNNPDIYFESARQDNARNHFGFDWNKEIHGMFNLEGSDLDCDIVKCSLGSPRLNNSRYGTVFPVEYEETYKTLLRENDSTCGYVLILSGYGQCPLWISADMFGALESRSRSLFLSYVSETLKTMLDRQPTLQESAEAYNAIPTSLLKHLGE